MKRAILLTAILVSVLATPAIAQDLNCNTPGVGQNIPVTDDPNNFDTDGDGIGCETPDGVNTTEGNTLEPANITESASASASAPAASQYQYSAPAAGAAVLPETSGAPLSAIILGTALLVGGGILAYRTRR